ncbi:MAG: hypothetical protein H6910_00985 [Rickettsiaceae bacterium]|nr:hypothetical protein [Rickettsiaceae bacterium]MCP5377680.1 hypothetical protein [Rickettsiaceae bacterium]
MFRFIKKLINKFLNNNYEGVMQEEPTNILQEENMELPEELKEAPPANGNHYSDTLQKLIGEGYNLTELHADAIGNREIIGDDQDLRTAIIIMYNVESSGLGG